MRFKSWKVWSSQQLTEVHQGMMETVMDHNIDWKAIEHQMRTTFNLEVVEYNRLRWNHSLDHNIR